MSRLIRVVLRLCWAATKVAAFLAGAVAVGLFALWLTVDRRFKESEVFVPDVRGLSVEAATAKLAHDDLVLTVDARRPSDTVGVGLVSYQDPVPGAATRKKRVVKVTVSQGPSRIVVPRVVGQVKRQAAMALRGAQLTVGDVAQVHSARAPADTVIAQEPEPGKVLFESGKVDLLVSLGPARRAYVMPDMRGRSLAEVERALDSVGMHVAELRRESVPGQPPGVVQSQLPLPGSRVYNDSAVTVVISREGPPGGPARGEMR